jgi:hypothetical protein
MKKSILLLPCLALGLLSTSAVGEGLDPSRVDWSKARLAAKKGLVSLGSDVEIERLSTSSARSSLIDASGGAAIQPDNPWLLSIGTKVLGAESQVRLWFNAPTGATLQRSELETGKGEKKDRLRTYRYTDEGVLKVTQRPGSGGSYDHPEKWARDDEHFYDFPEVPTARVDVTEPAALFYLLSVADLEKPGDQLRANLFTKGKLVKLTVAVEDAIEIEVDYLERSTRGERRVKDSIPVLELSVSGRPAAASSGSGDFKLLGLAGEKKIFLSPTLRIPVLLTGKLEKIGKGRIELKELTVD